jgi:uncharacterized radical SAM superfamily Fe-S cluster-containing enzyme
MQSPRSQTESLCPHCLRRIPARRINEGDSVFLEKSCPEHGDLDRVLVWRNSPTHFSQWKRQGGGNPAPAPSGCPHGCRTCPDHEQETCTAILEVTPQCNLHCPVCFASSGTLPGSVLKKDRIARMLASLLERGGPCPVQFSGGEPTLREDLPDIVALARNMGFAHIQINTNGIRLARDEAYAVALKEAGASVVFLQFDGVTDDVYFRIRGTGLWEIKRKAVERCAALKFGVILVPTLVSRVNDSQIGSILDFAREWIPTVKGVHFQPMTFIGRFPETPANDDRILIPDILRAIEDQTGGELKTENFLPSDCEEPHCSFSAFAILGEDGRLIPTTRFDPALEAADCCGENAARRSRDFVTSRWKYSEPEANLAVLNSSSECWCTAAENGLFNRARSHSLCISGMAFQDAWNLDLERLKRCCVHVLTPDADLIPFCAYYLTGSRGQRLYSGDPGE